MYRAVVDPAQRNSSHSLMLELIGPDVTVLDVGCASGYLAEALGRLGCRVSGVEYDAEDAERARPFLHELVVADLNQVSPAELFPGQLFDRIVFGDVLEHLLDPERVLTSAVQLLAPDGAVVISIPNVGHGSLRLSLLQGRWDYRDVGLLDRTHIRFFTLANLLQLVERAGLVVTELTSSVVDPLATEIPIDETALPMGAVDWVRSQPNSHDYQFVLSARRPGEGVVGTGQVEPAVRLEPVFDQHSEAAANLRTALEALSDPKATVSEVAGLRRDETAARARLYELTRTLDQLRAELTAVHRELEGLRQDNHRTHTALGNAMSDASRAHSALHEAMQDNVRAHSSLADARQDAVYAHSELAKSVADAQQAHARLQDARREIDQLHADLAAARIGPLRRMTTTARSLAGRFKRR